MGLLASSRPYVGHQAWWDHWSVANFTQLMFSEITTAFGSLFWIEWTKTTKLLDLSAGRYWSRMKRLMAWDQKSIPRHLNGEPVLCSPASVFSLLVVVMQLTPNQQITTDWIWKTCQMCQILQSLVPCGEEKSNQKNIKMNFENLFPSKAFILYDQMAPSPVTRLMTHLCDALFLFIYFCLCRMSTSTPALCPHFNMLTHWPLNWLHWIKRLSDCVSAWGHLLKQPSGQWGDSCAPKNQINKPTQTKPSERSCSMLRVWLRIHAPTYVLIIHLLMNNIC